MATFPFRIKHGESFLYINPQNRGRKGTLFTSAFRLAPTTTHQLQLLFFQLPPEDTGPNDFKCCDDLQCVKDATCSNALALGPHPSSNRAILLPANDPSTHLQLFPCQDSKKIAFHFSDGKFLRVTGNRVFINTVVQNFERDACFELYEMKNAFFNPADLELLVLKVNTPAPPPVTVSTPKAKAKEKETKDREDEHFPLFVILMVVLCLLFIFMCLQ